MKKTSHLTESAEYGFLVEYLSDCCADAENFHLCNYHLTRACLMQALRRTSARSVHITSCPVNFVGTRRRNIFCQVQHKMIRFLIFFGAVYFSLVVNALDYSDLHQTGKACPAQDSCHQMGTKEFEERSCECDSSCRSYMDCCIDGSASTKPRRSILSCIAYGEETKLGSFGKDYCPRGYNGFEKVKQFCEGQDDFSDPLLSAPITDTLEGVTYRNYYCAECHNASKNFLKYWLISLNFESLPTHLQNNDFVLRNLNFDSELKKWGVNAEGNFYPSNLVFHRPNFLILGRKCRPDVISSCPKTWRNASIKRACLSYMAVVHTSDKSYRNIHCAICNGEDVDSVSCIKNQAGTKQYDFKVLMDFNIHNQTNSISRMVEKCERANEVGNFAEKCRILDCVLPSSTSLDQAPFETIMSLSEYLEKVGEMNENCLNLKNW
ncbi:SMB domain-containing protein [Nephila pilipes]|uniref:SMB domain-containing protein n=1 Tax=Nephila pilipes TaxID=299642 RepID=A0A8X6QH83_NEPPI|nr:SMB domain-containing protein [Nephila pilipes]